MSRAKTGYGLLINISMNYQQTKIKLQKINKHCNSFNLRYQLLILIHPIKNATEKTLLPF